MKGFTFLLVACIAGAVVADHHKEKRIMKKWAMMKAMESCWGEQNMKKHMVSMKESAVKCSGIDAPELELPMFQSPYRVISALLENAERNEEHKMGMMFNRLQSNSPQILPVVVPQQQSGNDQFESMMKHFFFMKMMKKMHGRHHGGPHKDDMDMDEMDQDSESFSPFFQAKANKQFRMQDLLRFKRETNENEGRAGLLDLGDRLTEKLMEKKEMMESKIGNFTCILRDQNVLDAENELDLQGMKKMLRSYSYDDEWFKNKAEVVHENCYAVAQALPRSVLAESPYGPKMCKLKMFLQCMEMSKMKLCMNYDIKKKLEENFGPVSDLVEQTGLNENQLFPLVMKLLMGDMMED